MNKPRLRYLRNRVVEHIQGMPQKEENDATGSEGGKAVFDLAYFQITDGPGIQEDAMTSVPLAANVKNVTTNYDCGYRGCFAGWYALLAQKDGLLTEEDLYEDGLTRFKFDYNNLAKHFDITYYEARGLFGSFGGGYELLHVADELSISEENYSGSLVERLLRTLSITHKQVLDIRVGLLDEMIGGWTTKQSIIERYWGA